MTDKFGLPGDASRRRFCATVGATTLASVAGCTDSDDGSTDVADPSFRHPETVSVDEPFAIEVDGLPTGEAVTLDVRTDDADGATWRSSRTFQPDDGSIALEAGDSAATGFADGTAPGLIQRMEPEGERESPYAAPSEAALSIEVVVADETVGSSSLVRSLGDTDVARSDPDHDELIGDLYEPPGTGAAPGVVVLHGSGGRPLGSFAKLLASNGFAALALMYFGGAGLPEELVDVPVEYVETAIAWLLDHDRVTGASAGLFGFSKGAELALLAGSYLDDVGAVVSVNGSGVAWEGVSSPGPGSSWTYDGEPVPYVPYSEDFTGDTTRPIELEPMYTASLEAADDERLEAATIPVERIDGPVLLVSGGDDAMWDSERLSTIAAERLDRADRSTDHAHLVFDEAGHAITYPFVPTANRDVGWYMLGGTAAGYARADREYWPAAIETLETVADS